MHRDNLLDKLRFTSQYCFLIDFIKCRIFCIVELSLIYSLRLFFRDSVNVRKYGIGRNAKLRSNF